MFWDKKGDFKYGNLAKIILVLIIAIIIIYATATLTAGSKRGADIAACKAWTVFQSSVKVPIVGIQLKDFKNPCVTFKDELKGEEEEVHETIANGMHDTWKMYGEGRIDFFSDWDWLSKNTYCFIGNEIKIIDNKEVKKLNIDKFEKYLSNNYPPNSKYTYAEFLTGTQNTNLDFGIDEIPLNKNDKLYILFTVVQ